MNEKTKGKVFVSVIIILVIIIVALVIALFINKGGKENMEDSKTQTKEKNIKIVEDETSKIQLEEYKTDVFTMKKPKGWNVETGGSGVFYTIRTYDSKNTNNQIFLMIKVQPLLKSTSAKNMWQNYYAITGYNSQYKLFADAVVLDTPTTEGFYNKFNEIANFVKEIDPSFSTIEFPNFSNFTKQEEFASQASMKSVALDSKVLRATFDGDNSKEGEGLFMASVVNFGNQYSDDGYYMVYDITSITSEKDQFINYKDILLESVNSIKFSDSYVKQTIDNGNAQTQQSLALNASIQKSFDSYMDAWENRNKSYDIMSQKQSDATLGYERVYDTESGDIYKTYNGFTDDYDGQRYKTITDDMYTQKTSGYIEKIYN